MPVDFCSTEPPDETARRFVRAVLEQNTAATRTLLAAHPELCRQIDEPWFHFDAPALV